MTPTIDHETGHQADDTPSNGPATAPNDQRHGPASLAWAAGLVATLSACGGAGGDSEGAAGDAHAEAQRVFAQAASARSDTSVLADGQTRKQAAALTVPSANEFMDWAEQRFPQQFPRPGMPGVAGAAGYRFYAQSRNYLGVVGNEVYVYGPATQGQLARVGTLAEFAGAVAAGGLPASDADAARFLTQATFGMNSLSDITHLRAVGLQAWLDQQFATPAASHVDYVNQRASANADSSGRPRPRDEMSYEAIWQQWLFGADQLRARVSFALSQIFVVSNIAPDLRPHAMSSYMDMLNRHAFGDFRTLLREVTLHPTMGYYLNMVNSQKADAKTGAHPNENYAREVLQLFSIGLVKLQPNGLPQLDATGQTIATYDESVVQGFARAFTGWSFGNSTAFDRADENSPAAWTLFMKPYPAKHEPGTKKLLGGVTLPAGQTPEKDLEDALDNIFLHPNVGPFISRQLIQRLVTSNPSPDYIQRVASVFNQDSTGRRGNLQAVVRAILLDDEARKAPSGPTYGKLREPLVRLANLLRAMNARSSSGRNAIHYLDSPDSSLGQSPLLAPTVFNYFSPNYRPQGVVAQSGLVAPEFQITTETSIVGGLNFIVGLIKRGSIGSGETELKFNFAGFEALAANPAALVDVMDLLFMNQQMSPALRTRMTGMLNAMPANRPANRARAAITLACVSPDHMVQR